MKILDIRKINYENKMFWSFVPPYVGKKKKFCIQIFFWKCWLSSLTKITAFFKKHMPFLRRSFSKNQKGSISPFFLHFVQKPIFGATKHSRFPITNSEEIVLTHTLKNLEIGFLLGERAGGRIEGYVMKYEHGQIRKNVQFRHGKCSLISISCVSGFSI